MKIGFVSTWFERGAAYVTKQYADLLEACGHDVFIYARGESFAKGDPKWDKSNVTWGRKLYDTNLDFNHVSTWIKNNNLDCIFFNEQRDVKSVFRIKRFFPNLKIGTYIDYYTQNTVDDFSIYDFLICNTLRHYSVFSKFKQCYYIPWGTDINLYEYNQRNDEDIVFFHSAGMSNRKGTDVLIRAFIDGELYKDSKLVIHTQLPINQIANIGDIVLENYNISVIEKTVSAPGLYYLGDIYVYPTTLDGLGLTMYEALASGMPVITTNCAPMNEVVNEMVGRLVDVEVYKSRWDAYYWPLAFVDKQSLIESMKYYIDRKCDIKNLREQIRRYAEENCDWKKRKDQVNSAFVESRNFRYDKEYLDKKISDYNKKELKQVIKSLMPFVPGIIQRIYFRKR